MSSTWLVGRLSLALGLMIGYLVLGLSMRAGLFFLGIAAGKVSGRLALVLIVGGLAVLWSMIPRRDRFIAPGPRLNPADQPRLFEKLNKLALGVNQTMPREVYLIPDVNAWVSQRGGLMGVGSRRVMGIGLPLLQLLTVRQFEAVLAHEFGHFHGGDTRIGPWIYRTRAGIGRSVQTLAGMGRVKGMLGVLQYLQFPFVWYGNLFLRVTHAVSRIQELSADQLAARVVGAQALADGLRLIHRNALAFNSYINSEVAPALRAGLRPPLIEGFIGFIQSQGISEALDKNLEAELAGNRHDPYETHPPLRQRLEALQGRQTVNPDDADDVNALLLLDNIGMVESQMVASWMPRGSAPLKPVDWKDTGEHVILPGWRAICRENAGPLSDVTLESLILKVATIHEFAKKTAAWSPQIPPEPLRDYALSVLGAALGCALARSGWRIDKAPGHLWMELGDKKVNPFDLIGEMRAREFTREKWAETMKDLGLDPQTPALPE